MKSSTGVTATAFGTFQFAGVKVTLDVTVPSVVSVETNPMVTSAVGRVSRTIVNSLMPPASEVTSPVVGAIVKPAVSSSWLITATSSGVTAAYAPSVLVTGPTRIVYPWSPSSTTSSTPVTVIVCGTFQLAGVNVTDPVDTVPSAVLLDASAMVTLPSGSVSSTMLKVAVPPLSVVTSPDVGVTEMPAVSSLMLVTETSAGS